MRAELCCWSGLRCKQIHCTRAKCIVQ